MKILGIPPQQRNLETVFPTTSKAASYKILLEIHNLRKVHRYSIQVQSGYPVS